MYQIIKRLFDVIFSTLLILLLSPLLLAIIVALLIFNKGDIFFKQKRLGQKNKEFGIIKFSSMLKNSVNLPGGAITVRNDPRVTKLGHILRITKLNELPQLFNVLFGDMSFVGPRPLMNPGFELYTREVQSFLYQSKPGITGISSVVFRDEERLVTDSNMNHAEFYKLHIFPYKSELETWYYDNKSFAVDFLILILTAIMILNPKSKLAFKFFRSLPKSDFFNF
jgi:lipopolysaccharide/colanic/teichoic acid biosynthesis glycosyltransferase